MSVYELSIDPSGAESGAERVVKSFDKIKASAASMAGATGSSFDKMAAAYRQLSGLKGISEQTVNSLRAFSTVMREFRGPSQASVENTKKFLTVLNSLSGFRAPSAGGLRAFLTPLAEFKGPSAASAANTARLLAALGRVGNLPVVGRGFTNFLSELGAFKGPGVNAARNTTALLQALAGYKPNAGLGTTITRLREIETAANAAATAMSRLSNVKAPNTPAPPKPSGSGGSGGGSPRELARDYGTLETAVLRTQTAINALGGVLGIKFLAEASNNVIKIRSQLEAATGSVQQGRIQFEFLQNQSNKLGLEFVQTAKSYGMLLASLKGTNVTFKEGEDIFRGFSTAARALQLSADDVDGVFRALGQIMSKGKLQAEELRGQLGDRLPGAFTRFAVALNMTKPGELDNALKKGAISGDLLKDAILRVSKTLEIEFAASAGKAATTVDSAFNRLKNAFTFEAADFGARGFNQTLIQLANTITALIQSSALNTFFTGLAAVLKVAAENINLIVSIIGTVAIASFLKWASAITVASNTVKLLRTEMALMATANLFAQMTGGVGIVTRLSQAFTLLNIVIRENPFIFIAAAIVGVIALLSSFTSKTDEARKKLIEVGGSSALAQNALDAYNDRLNKGIIKQDEFTAAIQRSIDAQRSLALNSYGSTKFLGGNPSTLDTVLSSVGIGGSVEGQIPAELKGQLSRVGTFNKDGTFTPRQIDRDASGRVFSRDQQIKNARILAEVAAKTASYAGTLPEGNLKSRIGDQSKLMSGYLGQFDENLVSASGKKPTFSLTNDIYKPVFGDLNKDTTTALITGNVPPKPDAKAAAAARAYESDIQRAVKSFHDLDVAVQASRGYVNDVLGGLDSLTAKSRQVATDKVNSLEDGFNSATEKARGLMQVASGLGLVATNADVARASLVTFYAEQKRVQLQAEASARVGDSILDLTRENDIREKYVNNVMKSGAALQESNRHLDIERQLLDVLPDKRAALSKQLEEQTIRQESLNRAEAIGRAAEEARQAGVSATSGLSGYGAGLNTDQLGYYKELAAYVEELKNNTLGYNDAQITYLTDLKTAQIALTAALKEVDNQYEAVRQRASDDADAITAQLRGIFGVGTDTAKTFGERIKDLFKSLKDSFLDFAIFNPIKKWLTDALTGSYGRSSSGLSDAVANASDKQRDLNAITQEAANVMAQALAPVTDKGGAADKMVQAAGTLSAAADVIAGNKSNQSTVGGGVGGPYEPIVKASSDLMDAADAQARAARAAAEFSTQQGPSGYDPNKDPLVGGYGAASSPAASNDLIVTGLKAAAAKVLPSVIVGATSSPGGLFTSIIKNLTAPKDKNTGKTPVQTGFQDIKDAFSGKQGVGSSIGKAVDGIAKIGGELFKAVATFTTVRDTLSSRNGLNTSDTVASTVGGAAAGYQLGSNFGPIGGAIGAAAGGILGFLSDLFSTAPLANTQVVVGENGVAKIGGTYKQGKANVQASESGGRSLADLFNNFANTFNTDLKPGNYGSFGVQKNDQFYSVTGQIDRKGRPIGREGVDYFYQSKGNDLQGIALKTQLNKGQFPGLSETLQTVGRNTTSTTVQGIQNDLQVGINYDAFVDAAKKGSELTKTIYDLDKAYNTLSRQSKALGLSETNLARARTVLLKTYKNEFDYNINQQILQIKDPLLASYNDLLKEYKTAVGDAQAVGGDLTKVEELYGLKRVELVKQANQAANDAVKQSAQGLLDQLTSSTSSPLSPTAAFSNASSSYYDLQTQLRGGNFANVDNLATYAQNFLDTGKEVFKSSADFFTLFDNVTGFLREITGGSITSTTGIGGIGPTNASNLPELPGLQSIMDELAVQNDELLGITRGVGLAIIDGNATNADLLQQLIDLQAGGVSRFGNGSNGFDYQYSLRNF